MTSLAPGTLIGGRYELQEPVGEGGMSTVWRAVSKSSDLFARAVAVKVMKRGFSTQKEHLEMFLEEARIGAELQHANLVQVIDFVADPSGHCLILEWIEGMDLRTLNKVMARLERPLSWTLVAHVGIGILRGLAAAHERRLRDGTIAPVVHRDVSPQNILLGLNGGIKLTDFGMARARDRDAMTAPGVVKGTISYIAPEMLRGRPPTPASDLFSLACTMWEALAGERLFEAASDALVVKQIREGAVRPLEDWRPDVPARFVAAINRALSLEPARRTSARAMVQELGEIMRESGSWIDSDVLVGRTVAQARDAQGR
jgi:eukaryotic-like serine/threonine-protein kinase